MAEPRDAVPPPPPVAQPPMDQPVPAPMATDVPPGPGVQPPFVAAPIEGRRARTWLGLGVAGGLLAACCGIGGVAAGGLIIVGGQAINEQAQDAVDDYLAAVAAQRWQEAYELRCDGDRQEETLAQFTARESARPRIQSYDLGDLDPAELTVPARVVYVDSSEEVLSVPLEQNETGQFEVCGRIDQGQ